MRLILALLSVLALAIAPLGAPAQAHTLGARDCTHVHGAHSSHQPAKKKVAEDGRCCAAVAAFVLAEPDTDSALRLTQRVAAAATAVAQLHGRLPTGEDPPPRV